MIERAVFIGPPASGKGTQAAWLSKKTGVPVVSTGRMLREQEELGTPLGNLSRELSKTGTLLPDDAVTGLVAKWLSANGDRFFFDGFPRTLVQARAFDGLLADRGTPLDFAVIFEVPEEVRFERAVSRLTCRDCGKAAPQSVPSAAAGETCCPRCGGQLVRRRDDAAHVFSLRMEQYRRMTMPVLEFFRANELLIEVDGLGNPDEVSGRFAAALDRFGGV